MRPVRLVCTVVESTSIWNSAGGMWHHSSMRKSIKSHLFDGGGKRRLRRRSRISHKCSIGFRSGDSEGHDIWIISVSCSSNHWRPHVLCGWEHWGISSCSHACAAFLYTTRNMLGCYLLHELMGHTCVELVAWCPSFTQLIHFSVHYLCVYIYIQG